MIKGTLAPEAIKETIESLLKKKDEIDDELFKIREACEHLETEGEYRCDRDRYWWSGKCLICKSHLLANSGTPEYKLYASRVV